MGHKKSEILFKKLKIRNCYNFVEDNLRRFKIFKIFLNINNGIKPKRIISPNITNHNIRLCF